MWRPCAVPCRAFLPWPFSTATARQWQSGHVWHHFKARTCECSDLVARSLELVLVGGSHESAGRVRCAHQNQRERSANQSTARTHVLVFISYIHLWPKGTKNVEMAENETPVPRAPVLLCAVRFIDCPPSDGFLKISFVYMYVLPALQIARRLSFGK